MNLSDIADFYAECMKRGLTLEEAELELKTLKERERICNLSRDDLVREFMETLTESELWARAYEAICEDNFEWDDDLLRHELLQNI